MTYSFGRICFTVGPPHVTAGVAESGDPRHLQTSRWECGCRSSGPHQAMRWDPCDDHVRFASTLSEITAAHVMAQYHGESP